jgi:hypothetical protein
MFRTLMGEPQDRDLDSDSSYEFQWDSDDGSVPSLEGAPSVQDPGHKALVSSLQRSKTKPTKRTDGNKWKQPNRAIREPRQPFPTFETKNPDTGKVDLEDQIKSMKTARLARRRVQSRRRKRLDTLFKKAHMLAMNACRVYVAVQFDGSQMYHRYNSHSGSNFPPPDTWIVSRLCRLSFLPQLG